MKKIKLFLITLLCMVGVMNAVAQEVVVRGTNETVTCQITVDAAGVSGTGVLGSDDRTQCSWISKNSYDANGNCLVIDSDGSLGNAITSDGGYLRFGVVVGLSKTVRVFAPLGWEIEKYSFSVSKGGGLTPAVYIDGTRVHDGTVKFAKEGLSQSVLSFNISTYLVASTATFSNFIITLKKVGIQAEPINSVQKSNIGGHWSWKQEVPVPGTAYKVVNGSSTKDNLIVIGQKNNSTIETKDEDHDEVVITDNIEEGGEWLYGSDYTLTNYTDRVVGFYESHVNGQGYNVSTQWRVSPLAIGNMSGFAISNKSSLQIVAKIDLSRYYLKLSATFTELGMGNLGWNAAPEENIFIWNFYSLDQYKCYIAYKDAYNDFMDLADIVDPEKNPGIQDEPYYQKYLDLLDEIKNIPAQGYDEKSRTETYDRIRRMLDLIATIKIDYGTEDSGTQAGLVNPGAEDAVGTNGWSTSTVSGPVGSFSATDGGRTSAHKFELNNLRMYQEVKADPKNSKVLTPGVYYASVYWKAPVGSTFKFEVAGEFDKQSTEELAGEGLDGEWKHELLELVVVTDTRITISATHKGEGQAYIDDFELRRFCQNYYREDAATKTRVYKGLFNTKFNGKSSTLTNDEELGKHKILDLGPVATVDKDYPYADITNLSFYSKLQFDNSANPNGLVYTNDYAVTQYKESAEEQGPNLAPALPANNVIVAKENGLESSSLVLKNGYPYSSKWAFTAGKAQYDMTSFGTGLDDTDATVTFGTMMLPYSVATIPSDVKVYSATSISESGVLKLAEESSVVADKPYLVQYTGTSNPLFKANSENQDVAVETIGQAHNNGLLVGAYQLTEVSNDGTCYLLQKQNGKLAFYRVATAGLNVGPFRAYLKVPAAMSQSKISIMIEDESTGISEIENANCDDAVYDLQGRRVENVARLGVYVKNGKKFMVK